MFLIIDRVSVIPNFEWNKNKPWKKIELFVEKKLQKKTILGTYNQTLFFKKWSKGSQLLSAKVFLHEKWKTLKTVYSPINKTSLP